MNTFLKLAKEALKPSYKTAIWLLKMMLPITLGVAILSYYGVIEYISEFLSPLFGVMGLQGDASIVFITSIFASIYAAIGVMATMALDFREVTIIASMCLISHNLIIEGKVQKKAGANVIYISTLRIVVALVTAWILNLILPDDMTGTLLLPQSTVSAASLKDVFIGWFITIMPLSLKVLLIVYGLNFLQAILREYKLNAMLERPIYPLMRFMGMNKSVSLLWLIANTLGLAYGGMAINDELKRGYVTKEDSLRLNSSIAITHSLLEDSFLFIVIGVSVFWVSIPRLIMSIVVVWGERLYYKLIENIKNINRKKTVYYEN